MRKPLTLIIVTLSVVCTLKGMSRQSIQRIKAMLLCMVYLLTLSIQRSKHTMHWILCWYWYLWLLLYTEYYDVWKLYTTLYTEASHPYQEEKLFVIWKAFYLGGLVVQQSVWGSSFVKFLGLNKLQGWLQARCTANPQFLKLRGHSATQ